jgi:effector-binding domain-containing protein
MTIAPGAPSTEGLASAHDRVRRWAASNGLELRGDRWEIYSHRSEDSTAMHTEVYWALR